MVCPGSIACDYEDDEMWTVLSGVENVLAADLSVVAVVAQTVVGGEIAVGQEGDGVIG